MNKSAKVTNAGVDVHYEFSRVALCGADGWVVRRERLDHRDRDALRRQIARWPKGLTVVMEASFGWGWLSDLLEEMGFKVRLSNCYKVEQMRKARGWVKTNDKDAALSSLLPLEATNWWEVWRAPAEVRDRREWMRHRADLVKVQTEIKNRIHAIFHRHGIFHDFSDLFGGKGRLFLEQLSRGEDSQSRYLPPGAKVALRDDLELLGQLRHALARIAIILRTQLERSPLAGWLTSVPGFGLILSHVLMAEIGELGRFRNAKALASYSLLAPRAWDTGEADPARSPLGRHLGTRGNRTLKWAFIEASHSAVRSGGQWRAMFDRLTGGGKRDRSRGYIAVARSLVDVVYAVWREERMYQDRTLIGTQAPVGGGSMKKSSRPGTGRPVCPLVAAQM